MASEGLALAVDIGRFLAGTLTVLVLLRIAYILSANPIGEFTAELLYLRMRELRQAGITGFVALLIEVVEQLLPFLTRQGYIVALPDLQLWLDAAQAVLILVTSILIVLVVRRYTHRALDRRIRESMETLAYLEGQRRRRRHVERSDWDRRDDE